jgi:thiamine pyrophosphokinase
MVPLTYSFVREEGVLNAFDLVVLNASGALAPGAPLSAFFESLWSRARLRVCADGGANRVHDAPSAGAAVPRALPTLIAGDLDSIRPDVLRAYAGQGVPVVHSTCQDTTDLEKCLRLLLLSGRVDAEVTVATAVSSACDPVDAERVAFQRYWEDRQVDTTHPFDELTAVAASGQSDPRPVSQRPIILYGAFGGRFDHSLAAINVLHKCRGV